LILIDAFPQIAVSIFICGNLGYAVNDNFDVWFGRSNRNWDAVNDISVTLLDSAKSERSLVVYFSYIFSIYCHDNN
jgi:hypothetical protein